jgi:N-acetylmuramoyl-L-alanine amidase
MERLGKRILVIAVAVLLSTNSAQSTSHNKLTKVYHHTNGDAASRNLELGSLVFYFEQEPTIKNLSNQGKSNFVFFFPAVDASGTEVDAMIDAVNKSKPHNYSVKIERTKAPEQGLKLIFAYNPEAVGLSYDHFRSINLQKGVVFHVHNKELLGKIKSSSHKPVLSIAKAHNPTVVIDCGHGGSDAGAIGCAHVQEKEILLPIGLEVARLLQAQGVEAVLTRETDCTVNLDQRTTLANTCGADAFVSIHANSASSSEACGIETFCVDPTDFHGKFASLTPQEKKVADNFFLNRCAQGQLLADSLHANLIAQISEKKYPVCDRKVKHASSQVLLGAHMPAVLVEIGFVTNEPESRLLKSQKYQLVVAQGISNGILAFLHANNA